MPRRARMDAPGILHHVIVRGIERHRIVDDVADRNKICRAPGSACCRHRNQHLCLSPDDKPCAYSFAQPKKPIATMLKRGQPSPEGERDTSSDCNWVG